MGVSHWLSMADLDDVLFPIPGLLDYQAILTDGNNQDRLAHSCCAGACEHGAFLDAVYRVLMQSEACT